MDYSLQAPGFAVNWDVVFGRKWFASKTAALWVTTYPQPKNVRRRFSPTFGRRNEWKKYVFYCMEIPFLLSSSSFFFFLLSSFIFMKKLTTYQTIGIKRNNRPNSANNLIFYFKLFSLDLSQYSTLP